MPPEKSPGTRALILLAKIVQQVDQAAAEHLPVRLALKSSADAKGVLDEARAILLAAKRENGL